MKGMITFLAKAILFVLIRWRTCPSSTSCQVPDQFICNRTIFIRTMAQPYYGSAVLSIMQGCDERYSRISDLKPRHRVTNELRKLSNSRLFVEPATLPCSVEPPDTGELSIDGMLPHAP